MFRCEPVDASFFETASAKISETFHVAKPAAAVWDELTNDDPLHWCRITDEIRWTSLRPLGLGATRTVKSLKGGSVLNEYFFRWEEGRRKSFYVVDGFPPLFKRFAEDYVVEPTGSDSCTFTWTIAWDPKGGSFTNPVNKALLGTLLTDTRKYYGAS
jgi:hypothetical protein